MKSCFFLSNILLWPLIWGIMISHVDPKKILLIPRKGNVLLLNSRFGIHMTSLSFLFLGLMPPRPINDHVSDHVTMSMLGSRSI